ncbi:MAG: CoA transferase [Actinomycetota bacterium]
MAELIAPTHDAAGAPLAGLVVVELAGELTGYAGRLLHDLGADVTLVGEVDGSAESRFLHHGKGRAADPHGLLETADVVLYTGGADGSEPPAVGPQTIAVAFTAFGTTGPAADWVSTDLIRLAAGGLLWLGGYPDAGPVAPYGNQSARAVSTYGVVALLLALMERDHSGAGCTLEISAQEVMTQALETALPDFELTGKVRTRLGPEPPEAGSGIYPCRDGWVSMVAGRLGTTEAWRRLREWLVEAGEPGANDLWEAPWETLEHRQLPESRAHFAEIFRSFASSRTKGELYDEAQRRSIALAPVNAPLDVVADPQLVARSFLVEAEGTLVPAPPYRMSAPAPVDAVETAAVEVAP